MLNLYCYDKRIIYKTSDESEFEVYKRQGIQEGLKILESEIFPYQIDEAGFIILDENNNPLPLELKELIQNKVTTFEEEIEKVRILILSDFENSFNEIKLKYTLSEREGWALLVLESHSWIGEKDLNKIPALHAECSFTKNSDFISEKANEIINRSTEYRSFYGQRKAIKSNLLKELSECDTPEKLTSFRSENWKVNNA